MWSKIKKALNASLGRKDFRPLDAQSEVNSYLTHFMITDCLNQMIPSSDGSPYNILYVAKKTLGENDRENTTRGKILILPPWIEEIEDDAYLYTANGDLTLPPSLKKIGARAFFYFEGSLFVPSSVKEINENAFSQLGTYCKIYIDGKRGEIEGYPWGHTYPDFIRFAYE